MAEGRECWDCFYRGDRISMGVYKCRKTGKRVNGDYSCSHFLLEDSPNVHACRECDYFGYHDFGSIFQKDNYCEKKGKVVDPDGLACSYFIE